MTKRKIKEEVDMKSKEDEKVKLATGEDDEIEKNSNDEKVEKSLLSSTRKRKKQSPVWDYFREGVNDAGKPVAECMFCEGVFTMMHGTSTLARHAKKHGMGEHNKGQVNKNDQDTIKLNALATSTPKSEKKHNHITPKSDEEITEALVSWMADSQVPCEAVENRKFQKLIHLMVPRYTLPNSKYVKSKLIEKRELILGDENSSLIDHRQV